MKEKIVSLFVLGLLLTAFMASVNAEVVQRKTSRILGTGNIIYVDDDNTEGPWDGSIEYPYQYIRDGINASQDGDKILVADGIYNGENNKNLNFNGKNIIVQSINGPNNCVIDCENDGRGFMFYSGETSSALVDGITITNGNVIVNGGGGAIYISVESSPTIANCVIKNNQATIGGGGILIRRCSSPKIINCTIINNTAMLGGGIQCFTNGLPGFPTIVNCKILDNVATMNAGGGIHSFGYNTEIINCLIAGNRADNYYYGAIGGGIFYEWGDCQILDCTITNNYATSFSGGIYCYQADMKIKNSIIWNNSSPLGSEISLEQSIIWINYSDVERSEGAIYYIDDSEIVWGEGIIDSDPLFINLSNGDYHLLNHSPCIDAGDNDAVPSGVISDLDGNPRFIDVPYINDTGNGTPPIVDMGAYEVLYPTTIYVDDDNTMGPWLGTPEYPFQHIQDGINATSPGDTVFVFNGTYDENIIVNTTITLLGEDKKNTVIKGVTNIHVVDISALGVTIRNFTIRRSGIDDFLAGIYVRSDYITIMENIITDNTIGIMLHNSNDTTIFHNAITHNQDYGIHTYNSFYLNISRNTITSNGEDGIKLHNYLVVNPDKNHSNVIFQNAITNNGKNGIFIDFTANNSILHNTITNNDHYGIKLLESEKNIFSRNTIAQNNRSGIYIWSRSDENTIFQNNITSNQHNGINIFYSHDNNILENAFVKNHYSGIQIYYYSTGNTIYANTISENFQEGIYFWDGCQENIISTNMIANNNCGVSLLEPYAWAAPCFHNVIYHNNLISNNESAYDEYDNFWDNGYPSGGNYWDDYNGSDDYHGPNQDMPSGDRIGDTPYNIPGGNNRDRYPVLCPDGWSNAAPTAPSINGPTNGKAGVEYDYTFAATDTDGDDVYYYIDWDDDTVEGWFGPFDSGEEIIVSHTWDEKGTYTIGAKAKDTRDAEGGWGYLEVTMPLNQPHSQSQPSSQQS